MSTHLAESPIPTSPPSPSAPPAPSPGQLPCPVQSSAQKVPTPRSSLPPPLFPELRVFSDAVALALRWTYLCIRRCPALVGVLHQDKLPGGAAAAAAFGGAPGGTRASLDAEPEMELRKPALCCGGSSPRGPLLGVRVRLSSGEARGRGEASRASRDHLWVQPIPGGALGLATPQIPSALRLGALSCLTPGTPTTSHWLQAAPQASVYKGGGRAEPPKTPGGGGRSVLHVRVQNRLQL